MNTYKIGLMNDISDIDLTENLPVKIVYKDSRIFGIIATFFGGSFFLIPIAYLIKTLIIGEPLMQSGALPLLVISVLFAPLLILGLNLFLKKKEQIISADSISQKYVTLFKNEKWTEPLSNYKGLLLRTDIESGTESGATLTYALQLSHPEEKYSFFIFKNMQYEITSKKWQEYSVLFGLQPIERIGKDLSINRDYDTMLRPMIDLLKEGKLEIPLTSEPKPSEIIITPSLQGETIILPDQTEITRETNQFIFKRKALFGGSITIPFDTIASIVVDFDEHYHKWAWSVVIIEKDTYVRHVYAHGLSDHILTWLQKYLINAILT